MRQATVSDLRYRFKKLEQILREVPVIEITKRKRVIARLVPANPTTKPGVRISNGPRKT